MSGDRPLKGAAWRVGLCFVAVIELAAQGGYLRTLGPGAPNLIRLRNDILYVGRTSPIDGGNISVLFLRRSDGETTGSFEVGGSGSEKLLDLGVGPDGSLFLVGETTSDDFPAALDATQVPFRSAQGGRGTKNGFIVKVSPDGRLLFSMLVGGSGSDALSAVAVAADGTVWAAGETESPSLPMAAGGRDAYLDGKRDAFILQLSGDDGRILYGSYLGGSGADGAVALALDGDTLWAAGVTDSSDFPVNAGAQQDRLGGGRDAFVVAFDVRRPQEGPLHASYYGGQGNEEVRGLHLGPDGSIYLAGRTRSVDLPGAPGGPGPLDSGFVARFGLDGSLERALRLPAGGELVTGIASLPDGRVIVAAESDPLAGFDLLVNRDRGLLAPAAGRFLILDAALAGILAETPAQMAGLGGVAGIGADDSGSIYVAGSLPAQPSNAAISAFEIGGSDRRFGGSLVSSAERRDMATDADKEGGAESTTFAALTVEPPTPELTAGFIGYQMFATDGSQRFNGSGTGTVGGFLDPRSPCTPSSQTSGVAPPSLFLVNPRNGVAFHCVQANIPYLNSLAADSDGTFYAGDARSDGGNLHHVVVAGNLNSATTSLLGPLKNNLAAQDLSIDSSGVLWSLGRNNLEQVISINKSNGEAASVTSGVDSLLSGPPTLAISSGDVFYTPRNPSQQGWRLFGIDKLTGAVTSTTNLPTISSMTRFPVSADISPDNRLWVISRDLSHGWATPNVFLGHTDLSASQKTMTELPGVAPFGGSLVVHTTGLGIRDCTGTVSPTSLAVTAAGALVGGGTPKINITTPLGCYWEASGQNPSIADIASITSGDGSQPRSGLGNGTVNLGVTANLTGGPRAASFKAAGVTVSLTQQAALNSCAASIKPSSANVGSSAGSLKVEVDTAPGCPWSVLTSTLPLWAGVSSPGPFVGKASVDINFNVNSSSSPRSTVVQIAGGTLNLTQSAAANSCPVGIAPTSAQYSSEGGTIALNVVSAANCPWTVTESLPWITASTTQGPVQTGAQFSGALQIFLAANKNSGAARQGAVSIGGTSILVEQPASDTCALTVSAVDLKRTGDSVQIPIVSNCYWQRGSASPWLFVNGGSSPAKQGALTVQTLFANHGLPSTGYISIMMSKSANLSAPQFSSVVTVRQKGYLNGSVLYGVDGGGGRTPDTESKLYAIDTSSGSVIEEVALLPRRIVGLGFDAGRDILMGSSAFLNQPEGESLYYIDPLTGVMTHQSPLQPIGIKDFAYDSTTLTMYGWSNFRGQVDPDDTYELFRINSDSSLTRVGKADDATPFGVGLAADSQGRLYHFNQIDSTIVPNAIFLVNQNTGALSLGPFYSSSPYSKIEGATFSPDNTLYVTAHFTQTRSQSADLAIINVFNGLIQPLGPTVDYLTAIEFVPCIGGVSPEKLLVDEAGATLGLGVEIMPGCTWTASDNRTWIGFPQGSAGTSSGGVAVKIDPNPLNTPRTGQVNVGGQTIQVDQLSPLNGCPAVVTPAPVVVPAVQRGGSAPSPLTLEVSLANNCIWNTSGFPAWASMDPSAGNGFTPAEIGWQNNSGLPRTSMVNVAGRVVELIQDSAVNACTAQLDATSVDVGAAAGQTLVGVTVSDRCVWNTAQLPGWITVASQTGAGTAETSNPNVTLPAGGGHVKLAVKANAGVARSATIKVAGLDFVINQGTGATISVGTHTVSAGGASNRQFNVTASGSWNVISTASWVKLKTSSSGSGNQLVQYSVDPSTRYARSAEILVAGLVHTIKQAGALQGTWWGADGGGGGNDSRLYKIEPDTGRIAAMVGPIKLGANGPDIAVNSLAVHPYTGILYGTTNRRDSNNGRTLVRINKQTAVATKIGNGLGIFVLDQNSQPVGVTLHDVDFTAQGELYGMSGVAGASHLHSVDLTTGLATLIGQHGPGFIRGIGLGVDPTGKIVGGVRYWDDAVPGCEYEDGCLRLFGLDKTTGLLLLNPSIEVTNLPTLDTSLPDATGKLCSSDQQNPPARKIGSMDIDPHGNIYATVTPEAGSCPTHVVSIDAAGVIQGSGRTADRLVALAFDGGLLACTYSVEPKTSAFPAAGGSSSVDIVAPNGCPWSISDNRPWINVTATSGSGPRTIAYTVASHSSSSGRGGTIVLKDGGGTQVASLAVSQLGLAANPIAKLGAFTNGAWFRDLNGDFAFDGATEVSGWGSPGDTPVTGDWNGDGFRDLGVFSNGVWFLDRNGDGVFNPATDVKGWGAPGWLPVTGDWNGDGVTDLGVVDPSTSTWFLDLNGDFAFDAATEIRGWGSPGDTPVVGDWDGDGDDDIGVFSGGTWFIDFNGDGGFQLATDQRGWGVAGWIPVVGDWDGDGADEIGAIEPTSMAWFRDVNGDFLFDPATDLIGWGSPGDQPVVADWNGDGSDDVGVFSGGSWFIDSNGNQVFDPATDIRGWGAPGWTPVPGAWQ